MTCVTHPIPCPACLTEIRERNRALVAALRRAKGDMLWMFGAWDGSMGESEDIARPHAHANMDAIDAALAADAKAGEDR